MRSVGTYSDKMLKSHQDYIFVSSRRRGFKPIKTINGNGDNIVDDSNRIFSLVDRLS